MKKVASVALTIAVVASTGTIFASTDAGANLSNWYNGSLQKQSDTIVASSSKELSEGLSSFRSYVAEVKGEVASKVTDFGEKTLLESKSEIENHQNHYLEQLKKTEADLKDENLDEYSKQVQARETEAIESDVEEILVEILGN